MRAPRLGHNDHPKDQFTHDIEEVKSYQIIGGLGERSDLIVSKSVFPAFEENQEVKCRLHLALFLIRIKSRKSLLDAINTGITIKGIGNIDSLPVLRDENIIAHSGDFIAGQVGAGGVVGLAASAIRKYRGVEDQETKVFNLRSQDAKPRGQLKITNKLLNKTSGLRRSLIPPHFIDSLEEEISGVVFSEVLAHFTAEQVNEILSDSTNVNLTYKAPRLVLRINFPYDQLDSIGNRSKALMTSSFQDEAFPHPSPESYYAEVKIPRSRYDKTESAKEAFYLLIAQELKISPQKIVNFWPASDQPLPNNEEDSNFHLEKVSIQGLDLVVLLHN